VFLERNDFTRSPKTMSNIGVVQSYEVSEEFDSDLDLEEFEEMEEDDEEENGGEDKAGGESNLAEGDEEDEEDRPRKKAKV
jgi:hypothetical protein